MEPLCRPIQPPPPPKHTKTSGMAVLGFQPETSWRVPSLLPMDEKTSVFPPTSFILRLYFFPQVSVWGRVPVATTGRKPLLRSAEKEAVGCSCPSLGRKRFKTPDRTGVIRPSRVAETDLRKTSYRFISWTFPANGLALQGAPPRPATFNYIPGIISLFEATY